MNILNNLIHVNRWSGIQVIKSESVADHVWGMTSLALWWIPKLNEKRIKLGLKEIDLKEVIFKVSIHDVDEAFYCDIPRPFKHYDEYILNAIEGTAHKIMRETLGEEFINEIDNAKDDTLEGFYVRIFDFIQAGEKMCNEIDLGSKLMRNELLNVIGCLEEVRDSVIDRIYYEAEREFIDQFIEEFNNKLKE